MMKGMSVLLQYICPAPVEFDNDLHIIIFKKQAERAIVKEFENVIIFIDSDSERGIILKESIKWFESVWKCHDIKGQ